MIRVISGFVRAGHKIKRPADGPFELTPEEEARLVRNGAAEYVSEPVSGLPSLSASEIEHAARYNADMKLSELKDIAASLGLDASKCRSRREAADLLDRFYAGEDDGEEDDSEEDAPSLEASEPEA